MKFQEGYVLEKFKIEKSGKKLGVILRFPKMSDVKDALKLINKLVDENALVIAVKKKTLKEEREWLKSSIKDIKKKKLIFIAVEVNGQYLGNVEIISKPDGMSHVALLSIALDESIRNLGIGERIIKLAMKLAKQHLKTEVLRLGCFKGNSAIKLYKKLGFKKCGYFPKERKRGKIYHDCIIMNKFL